MSGRCRKPVCWSLANFLLLSVVQTTLSNLRFLLIQECGSYMERYTSPFLFSGIRPSGKSWLPDDNGLERRALWRHPDQVLYFPSHLTVSNS